MKFVVSDLDGTLLLSNHLVSEYTKDIINKLIKQDVNFVIATGRGKRGVKKILEQLGINPYLICNNGANIYDKNGNCIFEDIISPEISSCILKTIREHNLFFSAFREDYFYRDKNDTDIYFASDLFEERIIEDLDVCPELNKIIITNNDPNVILYINKILREKYSSVVEITISQPTCLDVSPKGCSKGTGLKHISEIFNIPLTEFMAFGDGENDLEMLRTAGMPVIMENAQDILKQEFSNIAESNINDGVAKYIAKYFNL